MKKLSLVSDIDILGHCSSVVLNVRYSPEGQRDSASRDLRTNRHKSSCNPREKRFPLCSDQSEVFYMKFRRIRQVDVRGQSTFQSFGTANDRGVEVLHQIRSQHIRVDRIIHTTPVDGLIEQAVNVIPLDFSTS